MQRILPALRVFLFALAALSSGLAAGCGLKGDLVLPEPAEPTSQSEPDDDEAAEAPGDGPRLK